MNESLDRALREAFAPSEERSSASILEQLQACGATHLMPPLLRSTDEGPRELLRVFSSTSDRQEAAKLLGGRYEMLGELERGSTALVLQARDRDLGREVALKILDAGALGDPASVDAFVWEARMRGRLEHPGCMPPIEIGLTEDGRPYLALRMPRGESLESLLAKRGEFHAELRRFLEIFEEAAQALAHAHERGIAHRWLDARKILVGPFGEVQIAGWDHAAAAADAAACAEDVRALGGLLCVILTGIDATERRELGLERLAQVVEPRELAELAARCLAREDSARPSGAGELAAEVGAWLRSSLVRERERELAAARAEQSATDARRARHWTIAVVSALLVLGASAAAFAVWRQSELEARRAGARERLGAGLERVEVALGRALAAAAGDPAAAALAVEAARRVELDARAEQADDELRARVARLLRRAEAQEREARAQRESQERRARMLAELEALRDRMALDWDLLALDRAFARLFTTQGLELESGSMDAVIAGARAHADRELLVSALDAWAAHRIHRGIQGADRVLDLALALDTDARRNEVRRAVRVRDVAALRDAVAELRAAPPSETMHRLVFAALQSAGERGLAEEEARRECAARPEAFWARLDLVGSWFRPSYERLGPVDADELGPALAALALRPSSLASTHLAALLLAKARRAPVALQLVESGREGWQALSAEQQPLLRMNLSSLRRDVGDLVGALEAQREALVVAPDDPRVRCNEGLLLGDLGKHDEAEAVLRALLEREPRNFQALSNLGLLISWHRKRPVEAEPFFRRAVECRPDDAFAWSHLGTCLYQQQERSKDREARTCQERALALDPNCLPALKMLAHLHFIEPRGTARAAELYRSALELAPGSAELQHLLGVALDRLGRKQEALHYLDAATRSAEATSRMWHDLSRALVSLERPGEARAAAERAVGLEESVANLVHLGGLLSDHFAEHERAVQILVRAFELGATKPDTDHLLAGLFRAIATRANGQPEEACQVVIELYEHPAQQAGTLRACAGFLRDGERSADAARFAARAAALAPRDHQLRLQLACTLQEAGRRDEALEALRRMEQDLARDAEAQREIGAALRVRWEDPEAAADLLRRAVKRWPGDVKLHLELALALRDLGAREEALRELAAADRLAPSAAGRIEAAALESELGRPARARLLARAALELEPSAARAWQLAAASAHALGRDLEALEALEAAPSGAFEDPEWRALRMELLAASGRYGEAARLLKPGASERELAVQARCLRCQRLAESWPASLDANATAEELLDDARVALARRSYRRSARSFARAFEADPTCFAAEPALRIEATEAALAAACGQGADGGLASTEESQAWRACALRWLGDDLAALDASAAELAVQREARSRLERWLLRVGPYLDAEGELALELTRARELREASIRATGDFVELPR